MVVVVVLIIIVLADTRRHLLLRVHSMRRHLPYVYVVQIRCSKGKERVERES